MMQIGIREQTLTQLAQDAENQQISAEELAEQIIRKHLRATKRQKMRQEIEVYRAHHAQILEKFGGEHIAMYHGEIVDHDTDLLQLALRIDERLPAQVVLITQVKPEVEETLVFRSPRFERP